jgi:hypothetical protein
LNDSTLLLGIFKNVKRTGYGHVGWVNNTAIYEFKRRAVICLDERFNEFFEGCS